MGRSRRSFNQLLEACSLAEEAGAQGGLDIGLRVRALMWSDGRVGIEGEEGVGGEGGQSQAEEESFVDSFVTPRAAGDAEGNVWADQVIIDAGATWREAVSMHTRCQFLCIRTLSDICRYNSRTRHMSESVWKN